MRVVSLCLISLFLPFFCQNLPAQEKTLKEAQKAFAEIDRSLNTVYQEAREKLTEWQFETVREEQRDWIEYRDQRAAAAAVFDGGADSGREKENPEYWNACTYLTETRIEILRAWMNAESFSAEWEGVWIDGNGGMLSIAEADDGTLQFSMQVVRGPTHHSGAISGKAQANQISARFATKTEGYEGETWLTFLREDIRIRIIGENTSYFHGARAYFDGEYIRVRELTPEDREEIKNPAF